MYTFLSIIYVLVCSFLIMVVLLQQGRGGMGSLSGGGQTVFGGSGAGNVLTRLTTVSAALFMILSATLAWMSSSSDSSLEAAMQEREDRNRAALHDAIEGEGGEGTSDEEGTPDAEEVAPTPTEEAPTEAAPTEAAPTEAAPTEAAPEAAPTEAAPTEEAPTEAAPTTP